MSKNKGALTFMAWYLAILAIGVIFVIAFNVKNPAVVFLLGIFFGIGSIAVAMYKTRRGGG